MTTTRSASGSKITSPKKEQRRLFKAVEGLRFDESAHRYFLGTRELLSVTRVLKEAGIVAAWGPDNSQNYYAMRGTRVHQATQLYDEGDLDEDALDPQLVPYLEGWKDFRKASGFEPVLIEQGLADPALGYAGTLDRVGMMGGRLVVLDIKTGSVPKCAGLQMAAYARLILEPTDRYAVQLSDDGKFSLHEFKDRGDRDVFLGALAVVSWKLRNT